MLKNASLLSFLAVLLTATALPAQASNTLNLYTQTLPESLKLDTPQRVANRKKPLNLNFIDINRDGAKFINRVTVFPLVGGVTALSNNGREFQIQPLPPKTILNGESVFSRSPLSWYGKGPVIIYKPGNGNNIMPAVLKRQDGQFGYRAQKTYLEQRGYRVLGQIGREFHDGKNLLRYFKINDGKTDPKIGQSAPNIFLSGIVGFKDGSVKYLDFSHVVGKGATANERLDDIKHNSIRPALQALEKNQAVTYMTIDTHALITKPSDIPNVVIRGGYTRGGPFLNHREGVYARCVRVFDLKSKKLVAVMITPALLMRDILPLAKFYFGNNVGIQFLDGDEPAAAYFEKKPKLNVPDEMAYNNHRVAQMFGQQLIVEKK